MEKIIRILVLILFFSASLSYGMSKASDNINTNKILDPILISAVRDGNIDSVKLTLQLGANPNLKDGRNNTLLMSAAIKGYLDTVKVLLDYGALVGTKNDLGQTVIDVLKILIRTSNSKFINAPLSEAFLKNCEYYERYLFNIIADYVDLSAENVYGPILELLEKTQKERIEKRNKKIKEILHERDFGVTITELQKLIQNYVFENEEVENSEENYALEDEQKKFVEQARTMINK